MDKYQHTSKILEKAKIRMLENAIISYESGLILGGCKEPYYACAMDTPYYTCAMDKYQHTSGILDTVEHCFPYKDINMKDSLSLGGRCTVSYQYQTENPAYFEVNSIEEELHSKELHAF